jgi:hypothetical protein
MACESYWDKQRRKLIIPSIVKQGRVSSLKDKKHPCSEDEWERILTEVLLDRQSDPEIEAAALVSAEQSVTLIVRRSISGIKVGLETSCY